MARFHHSTSQAKVYTRRKPNTRLIASFFHPHRCQAADERGHQPNLTCNNRVGPSASRASLLCLCFPPSIFLSLFLVSPFTQLLLGTVETGCHQATDGSPVPFEALRLAKLHHWFFSLCESHPRRPEPTNLDLFEPDTITAARARTHAHARSPIAATPDSSNPRPWPATGSTA